MSTATGKFFYTPGLMDLSSYRLERAAADTKWDSFVERSSQGSLFSLNAFLNALDRRPGRWYCLKNYEIRAAVAVIESEDGGSAVDHDLVIYNGIMLGPPDSAQNRAQIVSENFRTTSFIVEELARRYARIVIRTHPSFADIRPFLWHNYGAAEGTFRTDVRYTSVLDLSGAGESAVEESPLYAAANKSRRQEIRYGQSKDVRTKRCFDPDLFLRLHADTFARQGLSSEQDFAELRRVLESLDAADRLRMFASFTADGTVGSVAVFGIDRKRAYYLYGANDPRLRDSHTGTIVLWDAFRALAAEVPELDLEGINSPRRGYFKLSFGGSITPYYQLSL